MCFKACVESLVLWSVRKIKSLSFGIPMVWGEEKDHVTDCYFCMTKLHGMMIPVGLLYNGIFIYCLI